jgi:hypothetical protein
VSGSDFVEDPAVKAERERKIQAAADLEAKRAEANRKKAQDETDRMGKGDQG